MRSLLAIMMTWIAWASAQPIPKAYTTVAKETGIPARVLYAIAMQESPALLGKGVRKPWPWTLNVAGVGFRFGSRLAAARALQAYLRNGETRVDVGLMQVHYRFHAEKLGNAWIGLDPYRNIRVGAIILRECYARHLTWPAAIGCYHSNTPWRAARYTKSVQRLMVGLP